MDLQKRILEQQKSEITEHFIYKKLVPFIKHKKNQKIIKQIAKDELEHYNFWKNITKRDVKPDMGKVWRFVVITKLFGLTFSVKLLERGEQFAQEFYKRVSKKYPKSKSIIADEEKHEKQLISLLEEESLKYAGSIVLGLNDALVELTGALAGLTLALQNTRLIAVTGLVTGIAASLSMAASEYLSTKTDKTNNPYRAAGYTGFAYITTVVLLILPFFILSNVFYALGFTVFNAIAIIALFNYYISITHEESFRKRFFEMALLSLGVATISFFVGMLVRMFLPVDV